MRSKYIILPQAMHHLTNKLFDGVLKVQFGKKSVVFYEDRIEINAERLLWYNGVTEASASLAEGGIVFEHKGHKYSLSVDGAELSEENGNFVFLRKKDKITLIPQRAV